MLFFCFPNKRSAYNSRIKSKFNYNSTNIYRFASFVRAGKWGGSQMKIIALISNGIRMFESKIFMNFLDLFASIINNKFAEVPCRKEQTHFKWIKSENISVECLFTKIARMIDNLEKLLFYWTKNTF